jgi:hypothetical protein
MLSAEITTICFGYTASAATIIAQAASKGKRQLSSNSLYLIHQCSTYLSGVIDDMKNAIVTMEKTNNTIANLYANRSDEKIETFTEIMNRNLGKGEWLSADEALQAKLADEIITVSGTSNLDLSNIDIFNYPEIPSDKIIKTKEKSEKEEIEATGIAQAIVAGIKEFFNPQNKIVPEMNKTFIPINTLLNVEGIEFKNGKVELTEDQVKLLNDAIANANAGKKTADDKLVEKDAEIQTLKDEKEALNKNAGDETNPVKKETETPPAENKEEVDMNAVKGLFNLLP